MQTHPSGDDEDLLRRVRVGDLDAYAELYRRHVDLATRAAIRWTRQPADAADVVADSFANILRAIRSGSGPVNQFVAYLLTAIRHAAARSTGEGSRMVPAGIDEVSIAGREAAHAPAADVELFHAVELALVAEAFDRLPGRWSDVLIRTEIYGQSVQQIGADLGMRPNSVSALALRARQGLRAAWLEVQVR
jgi:RNA polymerase sigma factor (sigma-70 family)